jgi:hypothetical protein
MSGRATKRPDSYALRGGLHDLFAIVHAYQTIGQKFYPQGTTTVRSMVS